MVELPAVEKMKPSLNKELEAVMKAAVANYSAKQSVSSDITQSLCNVIEAIFIHGLKDTFFLRGSRYAKYPEPNFWPMISKYTHVNVSSQINNSKQIRTEIGRARAWVRIVINEGTLGTYISNMTGDSDSVRRFYVEEAFLRDSERVETMIGYLKAFDRLKFDIPVNSAFLNGWTPSPLILSGVILGKAMRADQRPSTSTRRRVNSVTMDDIQEDEVGVSALDLLDESGNALKSDSFLGMPGRLHLTSKRPASSASMPHLRALGGTKNEFDEDDGSSVCSHPSMMDGGLLFNNPPVIRPIYSPILSSTPETSAFVIPEITVPLELQSSEVVVKHRRHRFRRGSGGSGEGSQSRKSSQTRVQTPNGVAELCNQAQQTPGAAGVSYADSGIVMNSSAQWKKTDDVQTPPASPEEKSSGYELRVSSTKAVKIAPRAETLEAGLSGSLRDELLGTGVALSSSGNSLVGKGWAMPLPNAQHNSSVESDRYSVFSSSADTEASGTSVNFDSILQTALKHHSAANESNCENRLEESSQIETSVRSKHDEGCAFIETMNDGAANGGIEFAKLSIEETADEGSHRATCTYIRPQCDSTSSDSRDQTDSERSRDTASPDEDGDLVIIGSNLVNGIDEYGIEREPLPLLTQIAREQGLDSQNFRCQSCTRAIGVGLSIYKVCAFDARYYCEHCWSRDESLIPARLILNWDTKPRQISRRSKTFIESVADRPLIWLNEINPKLYAHSAVMDNIKLLREKLSLVAMYLLNCKQSIVEDFQRRLWGKDYLYREIHLYSFSDLINCTSGVLERHLNSLISFAVGHVHNCALCRQKGFICELCPHKQVIYPFQVETTSRCDKCFSVYHKKCFKKEPRCPKCFRREQYTSTTIHDDSLSQNYLTLD